MPADHKLLPDVQAEQWDGLWNPRGLLFAVGGAQGLEQFRIVAGVEVFDDGNQLWLSLSCEDVDEFDRIVAGAAIHLPGHRVEGIRAGMVRFHVEGDYTCSAQRDTSRAAAAAVDALIDAGYVAVEVDSPRTYFVE